ncbi:hypothetical protein H4R24_005309 [Coemansia sp. RSA 988]|nr:hypothetical protein H4R24_005309 [Coemansia sp. RSA 988]
MHTGRYAAYTLGLILAPTAALQIALEWTPDASTRSITSASSMLRIANGTAPPQTEWLALGWDYGSLGLQRRSGSDSVVMQLTPPSAAFQAIVGRAANSVEAHHRPTAVKDHLSQVQLEMPVQLDPTLEYYFKVQAHHDIGLNRTTYEGLYSTGDSWQYLGSLILQHPTASNTSATTDSASPKEAVPVLSHFLSSKNPSLQKTSTGKEEKKEERTNSGSESNSDSGSDSDSDTESTDGIWRPKHKEMFAQPTQDSSDNGVLNSALSDFIHAGLQALQSPFEEQSTSSAPAMETSTVHSAGLDDLASAMAVAPEILHHKRLTNEIVFPKVPLFPHLFSGIQRLDGANHSLLRAGIFKHFQLRDRLGETFLVTNVRAFVYDAEDVDVAIARHYVLASSYLLSIDGPRPGAFTSVEKSSSLSSTPSSSSATGGENLTEVITETKDESDASDSSSSI